MDSAERLTIRVLTTTAPAQCAVGSAQARNQPVHGQRPGNKLHGDRFVSRLSSFECCHSTLRCGAAPTHRNGAHSNAQRLLPTAGALFAVQLSRGECMASVPRRLLTVVCDAVRFSCREAGIRISRDDLHRECAPAATRPGPGAEQHPFGADDLVSRPVINTASPKKFFSPFRCRKDTGHRRVPLAENRITRLTRQVVRCYAVKFAALPIFDRIPCLENPRNSNSFRCSPPASADG